MSCKGFSGLGILFCLFSVYRRDLHWLVSTMQHWLETDKAAFLLRQYFFSNLHDRISTRPFLSLIEKKWLAFQVFVSVAIFKMMGPCTVGNLSGSWTLVPSLPQRCWYQCEDNSDCICALLFLSMKKIFLMWMSISCGFCSCYMLWNRAMSVECVTVLAWTLPVLISWPTHGYQMIRDPSKLYGHIYLNQHYVGSINLRKSPY